MTDGGWREGDILLTTGIIILSSSQSKIQRLLLSIANLVQVVRYNMFDTFLEHLIQQDSNGKLAEHGCGETFSG